MKQLRNIERKWLQSLGTVLVGNCPYCDAVVKLTPVVKLPGVSVAAESERCDAFGQTFRIYDTPVDEEPDLEELLAATTLESIADAAINQAKLPPDVLYPSLMKYLDFLREVSS